MKSKGPSVRPLRGIQTDPDERYLVTRTLLRNLDDRRASRVGSALVPGSHAGNGAFGSVASGATARDRTEDLLFTKQLLYH